MSRRKDNKGRVLRTGESQRKDLIYQYRYTDALGNRKCIYASDLKTLREKEDELQKRLDKIVASKDKKYCTVITFDLV